MDKYSDKDIIKLQNNLLLIRNAGGWTAEEFGDKLGVTKQTISNLENKKTEMTKIQYIAIRAVLDYEMEENPNNGVMPTDEQVVANATNEAQIKGNDASDGVEEEADATE